MYSRAKPTAPYRKMHALDARGIRNIAKALLLVTDFGAAFWNDWEKEFLTDLAEKTPNHLSTRQGEVLSRLQRAVELVTVVKGIEVNTMIVRAWASRDSLVEADQSWIAGIYKSGARALRGRQVGRLQKLLK